jgi:hypothetical protein
MTVASLVAETARAQKRVLLLKLWRTDDPTNGRGGAGIRADFPIYPSLHSLIHPNDLGEQSEWVYRGHLRLLPAHP